VAELNIRGRIITDSDIEYIRTLIERHKEKNRYDLSKILAEAWQWHQENGRLKDRACRAILSVLEQRQLITLPSLRQARRLVKRDITQTDFLFDLEPISQSHLDEVLPLHFKMVCQTADESLWNKLIRQYHYLSFTNLVGAHLKYLVYSRDGNLLAALGWGSAVWKLQPRDKAIGWTVEQRKNNLHKVINNNRFLILPWIKIANLASMILSRNIHLLCDDWYKRYNYRPCLLETFVDARRFKGTCYRAANWIYVGQTKGFEKQGNRFIFHGNLKEVFLYPITKHFRKELGQHSDDLAPLSHRYYLSVQASEQTERGKKMILHHKGWNRNLPPPMDLREEDIDELSQEFEQYHQLFDPFFYRTEQTALSRIYLQGLMSPIARKSMEPIALSLMTRQRVRALQHFMGSTGKWDTEPIATIHKQEAAKVVSDPNGVLCVDGSDFPKKGKESVGVARQYCGSLGKIDNCQAGVFLAYSSSRGYALLDRRLFIPECWFSEEYRERREKCQMPENLQFKTKIELALEMIQELGQQGNFPVRWIACDEFFGRDGNFLDQLSEGTFYFAEVPCNTRAWLKRPKTSLPRYSGKGGKPQKAKCAVKSKTVSELSKNKQLEWKTICLANGAKGPIVAEIARIRVIESRQSLPAQEVWLFIRRSLDRKEYKYFLSNAPVDCNIHEMCQVCTMRWPIEQCFQEGKSELGMDHYEHRSWIAWHRHMTFVFIAQLFLLMIRIKFKKKHLH
jgi:SRSO17 transposase